MFTFRGTLDRLLPSWLKARPDGKGGYRANAFKYLYSIATLIDAGVQFTLEGVRLNYPELGTPTALQYHGRDRRITRGFQEPDDVYAGRLLDWLPDHKTQGNPFTLMKQVRAYVFPFRPKMRVVNNQGTWYTLNPDDTIEIVKQAGNWNWDNSGILRARFWLIIYSDTGPWTEGPGWGDSDAPLWGGDPESTWGSTATPNQVASIKAIIDEWRSGTALSVNVIIAFDPASFDPAGSGAGYPDGLWGHWSKNVGGVQVPSRLSTARYWDGV